MIKFYRGGYGLFSCYVEFGENDFSIHFLVKKKYRCWGQSLVGLDVVERQFGLGIFLLIAL